jgi:hypothetical protein
VIERIDTFFLHGRSDDLTPLSFYRTIFLPTPTVTATCAVNAFTVGFQRVGDEYQVGFVGVDVRKAGFSPAPGRSDDLPRDDDWNRNGVTIEKCTYVTFELAVRKAEAVALCSLAIHAGTTAVAVGRATGRQGTIHPQALVVDKKSGLVRTVHHMNVVEGARLPSERFLTQAIKTCAAEGMKADPKALDVAFHDDPGYKFQPGTTYDRKARRLRS